MKIPDLKERYAQNAFVQDMAKAVKGHQQKRIGLKGTSGSLNALLSYGLAQQHKVHQMIILNDKEEAAYFLNDLEALVDDQALFYPASYRRPYETEKTDNANIQLRAEVLNRISASDKQYFIVTYPGALLEHVITKKKLAQNRVRWRSAVEDLCSTGNARK